MSLLSCENLTVNISNIKVCHDLTLAINAGENWAILGMNGSGKTTLLHHLAGLLLMQDGTIKINGQSHHQLSRKHIAQQISLLLQHQEDHFPGTVLESVLVGRHPPP